MSSVQSVGIIGLGNFGCLVANLVPVSIEVRGFSRSVKPIPKRIKRSTFESTITADIVVLASPLEALPTLLQKMQPFLKPETLVIDVCSVKVLPQQYFTKFLPNHPNILLTHPLFGPRSTINGTKGCELVVTTHKGQRALDVLDYCKNKLDFTVHNTTSEEHDKIMAQVHVLTFFVARGLHTMHLEKTPFGVPSYKMLEQLIEFDEGHSDELFQTIQHGNPYAKNLREQLLQSFQGVHQQLP